MDASASGDDNQFMDKNKANLDYVEIKTDHFKEESKYVKIGCCERSGNLLIGYANKIQIFKYFKKYSINRQLMFNNFVHLLDIKIAFDAEHFKLTEQLLLCSSIEHCQVINLDFQADLQLNSNIELCLDNQTIKEQINRSTDGEQTVEPNGDLIDEQVIYVPLFQNEQLKITDDGHLNEIIGPIDDKLCCRIDVTFDECLQIDLNNINILFCLNLATKSSLVEHQFEIIEEDGYSQIQAKDNNEIACKTFLLPCYDKQLSEYNNPLEELRNETQNPLRSSFNKRLIYFNFFVFKKDYLTYYLIDKNFKVEKFKLNQIDIKNFNLKSVIIDESFIYILMKDSLYTYYFGLFNILNYIHQLKFTSTLDQNLNELLKTVRPLLLNKNSFLGSNQLINTPVQLIVLSQDENAFTKYSLKKPSQKQSLFDAKENLNLIEQELNSKEKINFYFYLINLCKSIKLNQDLDCLYIDYCLILLKLLINSFPQTNSSRKLIMEFMFKYTNLKLVDLIEKNDKFLFKQYEQTEQHAKSILEDLIEQLIYEDKLSQTIFYDSLYNYKQQDLISKRVLDSLTDLNVLKLIQYLYSNSNLECSVYLIFKHQFKKSNWQTLKEDLIDKILNSDSSTILAISKILFDCEQFEELAQLITNTNEMNIFCELINYKEFILPSIDFLAYLVKLDMSKLIGFLHKLISSNISSEFIFRIFKDNKLLFILLDNYLSVTRSEQLPEKLLINLVVNYWKILNNELNYDLLCEELGLKYQWTVYQTPFINLLRPYHNENELDKLDEDSNENSNVLLERNDDERKIKKNEQCLCSICSPSFNKLQFILNVYSPNNEISSLLNHLIKNSQTNWSWRIKVQISDFSVAISILYDKLPETILFYILEQQNMDNDKWIMLIDFLDKKQKIHGLDSKLNHKILYHLANILSPLEFIKLIPEEWKPVMNYYFRICLEKYQGKCIKNQIMNYLDNDYVPNK